MWKTHFLNLIFVERVGFEPLFFRAREICYQLHHTPHNVIFVSIK